MTTSADDQRRSMMPAAPSWPLVGRTAEMEQVRAARAQGSAGIVIRAGAGVGKSRLAREAVAIFEDEGCETGWVQATQSATSVPLGAFATIIPPDVRSDDLFELMQRSVAALGERAGDRPFVLGVDDAQWLDPTSATLVLHLVTTGTAFVVVTVRSGEPCPDAIVSLWKDAGAHQLELRALTEIEAETLVEQIVGGPVELGARRWVAQTSQGNALYVRELVLGAIAGGALERVNGLWRLPTRPAVSASLSELVAARMAGLTGAQQRALELLAFGEPLRLGELLDLVGAEPLAVAEGRGLINLRGAGRGAEARLAHPLYGEVIRAGLPSLRAREARLRLAETIQARESRTPEDSLRLARWLTDAGEDISVELMLRAARAANLAGDPEFGAALAKQAWDAGGGIDAALLLARAHTVRSRFAEATAVLTSAQEGIDNQDSAVEYLEQQSEILHWGLKRPAELRELLDRAAGWWPDPAWQERLQPLRLRVASFERLGLNVSATTELLSAPEIGTDIRDRLEPVHVANLFYSGRTAEALELATSIRPELPLRNLSQAIALSLWSRVILETGERWTELADWMTSALEKGVRLGDRAAAGQAAYSLACLHFSAGRYIDAGRLLAEAEVQLESHDPVGLMPVADAMQVGVACFSNDPAAIGPALNRCRARVGEAGPLAHQLPYVVRAEAWAAHATGDPPRAQQLLIDAAKQLSPSPVHAARLTYEAIRAGAPARRLAPSLQRLAAQCDARLVSVYADHATALAANRGADLLRVADQMEQIGAFRYATEAAAHAADSFAREGRQNSARQAALRCRALNARGQRSALPTMAELDNPAVKLTPRESQLVELASRGLSNADIAERLVLSVRTVESHLYRAMQKLGVNDRHDL
jgi:DNA-binding CsgD family transcriptional regulator